MTIALVTGGAGFIGSHLVDALLLRGLQVRVLDRLVPQVHEQNQAQYLNPEAEMILGDVRDSSVYERALDGVSIVYHEAAEVGVGQSMYEIERYIGVNTLGTATLLEALVARRDQISKLVVASSMSIYGEGSYRCDGCGLVAPAARPMSQLLERRWELRCAQCDQDLIPLPTPETKQTVPTSVYAISKQDQEQLSLVVGRAYEIPTVALRYFNAYGTRQAPGNPYTGVCAIFSSRLLNDEPPMVFEDGQQTRDFLHVSDVVQANLRALDTDRADYEALNVGTGVATSVTSVTSMLAEGLGKDIEPNIVGKFREGDIRHCVADISKAVDLLGFKPAVQLEDGIPQLLEWVKCQQQAADRVSHATDELEARHLLR